MKHFIMFGRETEDNQLSITGNMLPKVDLEIATDVFKCFQDSMENFTDFTVLVGVTKFNCHRIFLSSCSGFFEALMRTDMREKSESSCTIEGISPDIFGLILDVIYKGRNVLSEENMLELWMAANQLQIQFLITACEKFVTKHVTPQNYKFVLNNAELLHSSTIIMEVKNVLARSYFDLVCSDNFMQVSLKELLEILRNNNLSVCPDFCVYSVLKWASADDYSNKPDELLIVQNGRSVWSNKGDYHEDAESIKHRRSCLNNLLDAIQLNRVSKECLSLLIINKYIIENKDAIFKVNLIAADRIMNNDVWYQNTRGTCKHCFLH
ncbi:kelch-like protein 6 [Physella acuta]|uniref:kelch-like protein 6 n=1 Tax=Physella acuta TaxID=109671 RepID=UPI0027DEA9F4|nr:kelch-like protein 6 [Physella acuta]